MKKNRFCYDLHKNKIPIKFLRLYKDKILLRIIRNILNISLCDIRV